MDKKSSAFNTSNLTDDENNITSKLRRLRMQEALLLQSIQKSGKHCKEDVETSSTPSYKDLLKKLKDSYIDCKNLYDEVKTNTQSQELLADLDIDEMKKKIFELETNIKTLKSNINSELAALRLNEVDLNKQILENPNEVENIKRRPRTHSEVQQFQEFMKNSVNRYGGWNEYNHNLFVKYWQKFFGNNYSSEFEDGKFQQSITYEMFIEDVIPKLQGVTSNSITSHVNWYVQYLFYKSNQQNAIDKWKWNKVTTKKVPKQVMYADEEYSLPMETNNDAQSFIANNFDTSRYGPPEQTPNKITRTKSLVTKGKLSIKQRGRYHTVMKPTKQWLNRYRHDDGDIGSSSDFHSIESMEKQLRTPNWRLGL